MAPASEPLLMVQRTMDGRTDGTAWPETLYPVLKGAAVKQMAYEAFAIANDSPYGLAAGLWTADTIHDYLQTKTVWIDRIGKTANPFIIR